MIATSWFIFSGCLLAAAVSHAAEKPKPDGTKPDAASWVTKSFRMSSYGPSINGENGQPEISTQFPDAPAADVPEAEWMRHAKVATPLLKKFFADLGITLMPGTVFVADRKSMTYAVRTSAECFSDITLVSEAELAKIPLHLMFEVHVVQADAGSLRDVVKVSQMRGDLVEEFHRLCDAANKNHAHILHSARIEARSGQRVLIEAGPEHQHQEGFKLDAQGRVEWKRGLQNAGLHFEIDPVIGPDGWTVDANFDLQYHYAPPTERMELAGDAGPAGRIEVPVTDYHRAHVQTAMTFGDGMTRLIGVWRPVGVEDLEKQDVLQAAFLSVNVVRLMPAENKTLAASLSKVADKVAPAGADANAPAKEVPKGMTVRRFKVPPDFLSSSIELAAGNPPPDPFAPREHDQNALQKRCLLPKDILKAWGVRFPEGATAIFDAGTSTLIITNTPENLDAVDAYVGGIICCKRPHGLVHTLHIIEGDAATLRALSEEMKNEADHNGVLSRLEKLAKEGKASFVSTQRIETRSGQRTLINAGTNRMNVTKFRKGDKNGEMIAAVESELVGTQLEIDPVMGPDGYTIDVNLALDHDYAPPAQENHGGGGDEKSRRLETNTIQLHRAKVQTCTTLWTGTSRIIGLWKPEGAQRDGKDVLQIAILCVKYLQFGKGDMTGQQEVDKK